MNIIYLYEYIYMNIISNFFASPLLFQKIWKVSTPSPKTLQLNLH